MPELDEDPVIELNLDESDSESPFNLSCKFEAIQPQGQEAYEYTVTWFVDDQMKLSEQVGDKTVSVITESTLGSLNYGAKVGILQPVYILYTYAMNRYFHNTTNIENGPLVMCVCVCVWCVFIQKVLYLFRIREKGMLC